MSNDKEKEEIPKWKRDLAMISVRPHYEPWYDDHADYNTNAKSYYDYLARINKYLRTLTDFLNRLAERDLNTQDTDSIEFIKEFDWQGDDPDYDDIVRLLANVRISDATEIKTTLDNIEPSSYEIKNGTKIKGTGVWSPDYFDIIQSLNDEIGNLQNTNNNLNEELNNVKQEVTMLRGSLQKIITNLHNSGALTNDNIENYAFRSGRNIATGNINLFGGTPDGNSFIRTTSGNSNNDITAGY